MLALIVEIVSINIYRHLYGREQSRVLEGQEFADDSK